MAKRRGNNEGSIRKRGPKSWEGRCTVGYNPETGKQIFRYVSGATQQAVRKEVKAIISEVDEGTYKEPVEMTVGEWLDIWHKEYLMGVKPSTVLSYSQHIRNHLKPAFGTLPLTSLHPAQIQIFYNEKRRGGLSAKTVKNIHGVFHRALKQATMLGYLRTNPSDNSILPRIEKPEMQPLDTPDIKAFLRAVQGTRLEALLVVDLFTGLRQGEILGLQWDYVDFERGQIIVNKQLCRPYVKGDVYKFGSLKNDKKRVITPAPYVMNVLKAHKKAQLEMRLRAGALWDEGNFPGLVFTTETGRHLVYQIVLREYNKVLEKACIPKRRFHDLRHTYAVSSLRSGDDVKTVQENLGHHTAAFTLDQYGHVTDTMRQESSRRMEAFIHTVT